MRQVRTSVEIREGVKVGMLFTPRLYSFKGEQGVTLEADTTDTMQVYSLYADIMFCAALNLWTLEGKAKEDATFSRLDFHEFSAANPKEFAKVLNFALEALTGKRMNDFISNAEKVAEKGVKSSNTEDKNSKKDSCRLTTWLSRLFS